jgi:hypothetical protein
MTADLTFKLNDRCSQLQNMKLNKTSSPKIQINKWKKTESRKEAETHWVDLWLQRISNFSQFGLFLMTIYSLYFVVIPLYQKEVLTEAIARKEIELKQLNTSLEQSYSELRSYYMSNFIRQASLKCTGLDIDPREMKISGKEIPIALTIKISECLIEPLNSSKDIKRLRQKDIETINLEIVALEKILENEQASALETYKIIAEKAKTDKSILQPIDVDSFSGKMLEMFTKIGRSKSYLDNYKMEISINITQRKVASDYVSSVMAKISKLHDINWEKHG